MHNLPTSISRDTNLWDGKKAFLNNVIGKRAAQDYLHGLNNWALFDFAIYFQAAFIVLNILSALAMGIVGYLSPWPMLLMALLLSIPIFPTLFSYQYEENMKLFGWMQLTSGFVELFWSSCVLLDMRYHSNVWRAYYTMCIVSWQFFSVILISLKCPSLGKVINAQNNQVISENSITSEPSNCNVDVRIAKLRTVLNIEKERLEERSKRREERLKKGESLKRLEKSIKADSRTTGESSDQTVNKISDLKTVNEQNDKNKEGESSKD